jgi:outer membrane protein OmpA-like peptidoglycan-associated protein
MYRSISRLILLTLFSALAVAPTAMADNCSNAQQRVEDALTQPPATGTEDVFRQAFGQCPNHPRLYLLVGDYYNEWSKKAALAEDQAMFNYLATEYYAKGIKSGQGEEVQALKYKLAALESDTEEITSVGIRSIKPGARLNIKVLFEFGSAELTAGAQDQLDLLGEYLAEGDASRFILEGHTDMAGTEDYNLMLSQERAESAKQYLIREFNVAPDSIQTQGYGFDRLADVDDPYSAINRRVRVRKLPN